MTLEQVRRAYATDLCRRLHIVDERIWRALAETPREEFLGPRPWTMTGTDAAMGGKPGEAIVDEPEHVYRDASVALDPGRRLYNGAPGILMPWIAALELTEGDRVFHLGGGTGYYTAIMAAIVGRGGSVLMAEVDRDLGCRARSALAPFRNVEVLIGDGVLHDPGECDAILVNAGVTHPVPIWLRRLRNGGRLVLPLTFEFPNSTLGKGAAFRVAKHSFAFSAAALPAKQPVVVFSCTAGRDPELNEQLLRAYNGKAPMINQVQSIRIDAHDADPTCWVHADSMCLSTRQAHIGGASQRQD